MFWPWCNRNKLCVRPHSLGLTVCLCFHDCQIYVLWPVHEEMTSKQERGGKGKEKIHCLSILITKQALKKNMVVIPFKLQLYSLVFWPNPSSSCNRFFENNDSDSLLYNPAHHRDKAYSQDSQAHSMKDTLFTRSVITQHLQGTVINEYDDI